MKVNSSIIDQVDYINGLMTVTFKNGSVYQYQGVQPDDHRKMIQASSVGEYFKKNMKGYKYQKIKTGLVK